MDSCSGTGWVVFVCFGVICLSSASSLKITMGLEEDPFSYAEAHMLY